jgi:predicted unusual protein kinase regulating ubiquinone biosynthesis (AarF/ABC1/UbiB family)
MGILLNTQHLKRYKDIAWLLMKYGRSDIVQKAGLEEVPVGDIETVDIGEAKELAADLEKMGPTFIKLAQLLSTRADLLPLPYLDALARLQDDVEPFPFAEVEQIVSAELGVRLSKGFSEFEEIPIAAASLGQVHFARMRDGRPVVVKVQRPGVREVIVKDLEVLESVAEFLDNHTEAGKKYEFQPMLIEFRKSLLRELDYRQEARNLMTFSENLKDFERIDVPLPLEDYTTSRVLTMGYVQGKKITTLSPLARIDLDSLELAENLFHAYLQQILVDGFCHADPHPGNVFLTDSGSIALIDLGMVVRIAPHLQEQLLQLLLALSDGRGNEAAEITVRMGDAKEDFDEKLFSRHISELVTQHDGANLGEINAGRLVLEITRSAGEHGFRMPVEFTMIAKTLLNLDQVVHTLAPDFSPSVSIRRHASQIMRQRMMKSLSPGNIFTSALEVKEFAERLPSRVNKFLDVVANNELKLQVDAIDEATLVEGFQKIANRITLGLILAALIVGAALMMRVETSFKILGYPGVAIIFFMLAAGGAIVMAINILFNDEKSNRKSGSNR